MQYPAKATPPKADFDNVHLEDTMTTPSRGTGRARTTTPQGGGNNPPPVDPIADAVARAHRSGLNAWNAMYRQHLDDAAQTGATIVAAGLATAHNQAISPVAVNQAALTAALGGQQVQQVPVQPANPGGQGNQNVNANGDGFFTRLAHRPMMVLAGLGLGVIGGMLVFLLVKNVAGGSGGWAHSGTTEIIFVILGAIAGAIILDWATVSRAQQGGGVYVVYPNLPVPQAQPVATVQPATAPTPQQPPAQPNNP